MFRKIDGGNPAESCAAVLSPRPACDQSFLEQQDRRAIAHSPCAFSVPAQSRPLRRSSACNQASDAFSAHVRESVACGYSLKSFRGDRELFRRVFAFRPQANRSGRSIAGGVRQSARTRQRRIRVRRIADRATAAARIPKKLPRARAAARCSRAVAQSFASAESRWPSRSSARAKYQRANARRGCGLSRLQRPSSCRDCVCSAA